MKNNFWKKNNLFKKLCCACPVLVLCLSSRVRCSQQRTLGLWSNLGEAVPLLCSSFHMCVSMVSLCLHILCVQLTGCWAHTGTAVFPVVVREGTKGAKDRNMSLFVTNPIQRKASPSAVCHWNSMYQSLMSQQQKLQATVQFP